jgi:hypothetical protein
MQNSGAEIYKHQSDTFTKLWLVQQNDWFVIVQADKNFRKRVHTLENKTFWAFKRV